MSPSPHRSSFGMLLRRSKSGELKKQAARDQELLRQRDVSVSQLPPRLPVLYNGAPAPQLQIGSEIHPDSSANASSPVDSSQHPHQQPQNQHQIPPNAASATSHAHMDTAHSSVSPPAVPNGGFDPYARTESMTHRGRYSYASSAISTINSPRRVRRRKDPTPFNILVIGTRNCGKTSFLEFLKNALALPAKKRAKTTELDDVVPRAPASGKFIPHYLETEIDNERIGLTLWDSEGLEKNVVDLQLREMAAFLESKFEETFTEEMKVVRSPGVQDTHIHAVFLVLDPARLDRNIAATKPAPANGRQNGGGANSKQQYSQTSRVLGSLDEDLDLQVLRTLQGKTTVIPVISKADTVTTKHMNQLKRTVWDSLKKANLDPLAALGLDDEDSSRIEEEEEEEDEEGDGGEEGEEEAETKEEAKDDGAEHDHEGDETAEGDKQPIESAQQDGAAAATSPSASGRKSVSGGSGRRNKNAAAASEETPEDEVPYMPLSILSPDIYEPGVVGRQFPWGFADPYNDQHCDFLRLKDAVFSEWRAELREASREQWYEGWRTSRLNRRETKPRR